MHRIDSDGVTVWVNSDNGLLGRFGKYCIDIHRPAEDQVSRGVCLHCTHAPVTAADWDIFVVKMKEFFGITIPDHHKPKRLSR